MVLMCDGISFLCCIAKGYLINLAFKVKYFSADQYITLKVIVAIKLQLSNRELDCILCKILLL